MCITFGTCPDPYSIIEPRSNIMEFWLSAKTKIRPKRLCNSTSDFDQYACLQASRAGFLDDAFLG